MFKEKFIVAFFCMNQSLADDWVAYYFGNPHAKANLAYRIITSALGLRWAHGSVIIGERSVAETKGFSALNHIDPQGLLPPAERHVIYTKVYDETLASMPLHSLQNTGYQAAGILKDWLPKD